ncbi:hypothetical protein F2Q70_00024253 [Brassica cretica]|uniref:Agenet domain-containing protein n=1 Tax=Brassica cretica TaxID=69181 RepID=A0A8S9LEU9_BRACR|nr:hypothetical protein F2Q70_00024253 [Brassica cretica]
MGTEMVKGSEVEVSSQEEGLKGAYFRALLEENTTMSGRKKVSVRYKTLLTDDGSSPLTEAVQQSLLRPVPPEEEYAGVVLEEGTVVDAYLRDGWWTGVIINKKLEDSNFLVCFDSPPDIIVFEKTNLRAHVVWTDSKWVRPDLNEVDKKTMFCPGRMVEVSSSVDKAEDAWFPAMLIKEIEVDGEKKFIVKDCNHEARPNTTVVPRRVRPQPPPPSSVEEKYTLMDRVEAFHGSVWRKGLVKEVRTGKRYKVFLVATKEEHFFSQSDVRPLKVWEDGAWHDVSKEETASKGVKPKTVTSKRARKHETAETFAATRELGNKKADAVMVNDETSPPVITPIAKEPASVVAPSPPLIAAATPLKQTGTETEGQLSSGPRSKQNGLEKNDSIPPHKMPEEETSQVLSRKRRREEEEEQHSDVNETEVTSSSSHQTPNVMMMNSAANVEETPPPALLMALPFAKRSPYWKSPEAKEGYKTMPQRPHFSPLLAAEDVNHREWSAVGMTVSFYGFLEQVKGLKPHDSLSVLCSLSASFVELEEYGFDIGAPQSRIRKMMSLKDEQAKIAEEKQCLEKKVGEDEKRSRKLAEEMDVLKGKMLELQRQEAVARGEKEAADKRVVEMKASGERFEQKMEDVKLEFLETASAPW